MSDRKILILVMSVLVVLVVGGGIGFQAWRTQRLPAAVIAGWADQVPVAVVDGQPLMLGPSAAPVTVTLYEDFHCPHCADFEEEYGPALAAALVAGTAQLEVYPMAFVDEGSTRAANAMACAAEAGFGLRYYGGLFGNHTLQWTTIQLVDLAGKVGAAATPAFTTCVTDGTHLRWVDSVNATAERTGVKQTPTLLVGGAAVDITTLTPATLDAMILDAATRKSRP